MIELLWEDGSLTKAPTWKDVEKQARLAQWVLYKTPHDFRLDMRARAKRWTGSDKKIRVDGSSRAFIRALERAGMLRIQDSREETP